MGTLEESEIRRLRAEITLICGALRSQEVWIRDAFEAHEKRLACLEKKVEETKNDNT